MSIYEILLYPHSILRWLILLLLVLAFVKSSIGWMSAQSYTALDNRLAIFALIGTHVQFVLGMALYFISPTVKVGLADMGATMKDAHLRYWTVEHISVMLIAIVLITLGRSISKRKSKATAKHRTVAIYYGLGLLLILSRVPWDRLYPG